MSIPPMEWTAEQIAILIKNFKGRPELWDFGSDEFKDRNRKNQSWFELADIMKIDKQHVERKVRSLIGQYQRECRKESGSGVVTWRWFKHLLFLRDRAKPRSGDISFLLERDADYTCELADSRELQEFVTPPVKRLKPNFPEPVEHVQREKFSLPIEPTSSQMYGHNMMTQSLQADSQIKDEFSTFGEHIAFRIRNIPAPSVRSTLLYKINNLIYEAEVSMYRAPNISRYAQGTSRSGTVSTGPKIRSCISVESSTHEDSVLSDESQDLDDILSVKEEPWCNTEAEDQ